MISLLRISFLAVVFFSHCYCAPTSYYSSAPDVSTKRGQLMYLRKFGYLLEDVENVIDVDESNSKLKNVIKHFQEMAAIPQTGILDDTTVGMMKVGRCGNTDTDIIHLGNGKSRAKRYSVHETSWAKTTLTYRVTQYSTKLGRRDVDADVDLAFQAWRDNSPLKFIKVQYGIPDIEIKFATRAHRDEFPFDGEDNILAHAFYPYFGGDLHLDDDEDWTSIAQRGPGPVLYNVVLHELGHALGLQHSSDRDAVMHEYYKDSSQIHQDDIAGIESIYGSPAQRIPSETTPSVTTVPVDYCSLRKVDAFTRYDNHMDYAFAGEYFYQLGSNGLVGSPIKISTFQGVPSDIDAALYIDPPQHSAIGELYIFKGSYVWTIKNNSPSHAKLIKDEFPGIPDDIDAAFVWGGNERTYIFKGNQYYRLARRSKTVDRFYPKDISVWNLPGPIDAASWASDFDNYFFIGTRYYRYDGVSLQNADLYPMRIADRWFGCTSSEK